MNRNLSKTRIPTQNKSVNLIIFLIFLLLSYVITTIGLIVLSYILYHFHLAEEAVNIGIVVIYVLSAFLSAFICGKKRKQRKFVWGLAIGLAYFMILLVLSMIVGEVPISPDTNIVTTLLICGASGMLGGMLA